MEVESKHSKAEELFALENDDKVMLAEIMVNIKTRKGLKSIVSLVDSELSKSLIQ